MFDLPKPMLKQLLTLYQTRKDSLTEAEQEIAGRIEFCCLCENYWVRRLDRSPDRCPCCHKRGWNRPLINQMLNTLKTTLTHQIIPQGKLPESAEGGNQP